MKTNQLLENKLKAYQNTHRSSAVKHIPKSNKNLQLGGAMLTGLPLLMLSGEALSQPVVTTLGTPICLPTAGSSFGNTYLNIDNSGGNDLLLGIYAASAFGYVYAYGPTLNSYSVAKLNSGDPINITRGSDFGILAAGGSTSNFGNWFNDPTPGFLGFSFISDIDNQRHNGWVELSIDNSPNNLFSNSPSKLTISRYAYETQPNTTIIAGDGGAPPQAQEVPTLSEWGLITLALFLMTFGTVYIGRTQSMLAGSGSTRSIGSVFSKPPLVWSVLKKTLLATAGLAAVAGLITYMVYGSIAAVDILGTAVAGPLLAYLMHLIVVFEKERKRN